MYGRLNRLYDSRFLKPGRSEPFQKKENHDDQANFGYDEQVLQE